MSAVFEDEVRAMLRRRAADIPDADGTDAGIAVVGIADPVVPVGTRTALGTPRRPRWPVVAAVVVLLLGAVGLVASIRGSGGREDVGPAGPGDLPAGPAPAVPGLPDGLTPDDLLPLWTPTAADVAAVGPDEPGQPSVAPLYFARYLDDRFGEPGYGNSGRWKAVDGSPGWYRGTFRLTAPDGRDDSPEAEAYLRREREGWSVMAVVSEAYDLTALVVGGSGLDGSVTGTYDGAWAMGAGPRPSNLRLDTWSTDVLPVVAPSLEGGSVSFDDQVMAPGPTTLVATPVEILPGTDPGVAPPFTELAFEWPAEAPSEPAIGLPQGLSVDDLEPLWSDADADGPAGVAVGYLNDRLADVGPVAFATGTEPTSDPDVVLVGWTLSDAEGPVTGSGTVVVRTDPDGPVVVAALDEHFDVTTVTVADGWPRGTITSTYEGEWIKGLGVPAASLSLAQWQALDAYLSGLDTEGGVEGSSSFGPRPPGLDGGPVALVVVGRAEPGAAPPFVELAFAT